MKNEKSIIRIIGEAILVFLILLFIMSAESIINAVLDLLF